MKKSKVIPPIMIVVAVLATIMLNQEEYSEVTIINKILIIVGAAVLSSVIGALMVETPQSVPTAPSMQRHTMRVVLVIKCKSKNLNGNTNDTETILYRATTRF